ncbi:hypothetical protein [Providencia rettgeri]|uniref:hypothetical protein n=1 Tax=Providencia TaxID=586 RepID=UPI0030159786
MFNECKEDFRSWLIQQNKLSIKSAGDIISRCRRLEVEVLDSIDLSVSTPELYADALKKIKNYAVLNKKTLRAQYNLTKSYRAALKKYCQYVKPDAHEHYPSGYSIR